MGYGSTVAVEDGEVKYRAACAKRIEIDAAELVAAGDMTREEAIAAATGALRQEIDADGDDTGTLATMLNPPVPSKPVPAAQVRAIGRELRDAAGDAAKTF